MLIVFKVGSIIGRKVKHQDYVYAQRVEFKSRVMGFFHSRFCEWVKLTRSNRPLLPLV